MANTFCMNNGEDTWIFTVNGEAATCEKINAAGHIIKDFAITTREQAREMWATAFRLAPNFMAKGSVMPATCTIYPEYAYIQDEADQPLPFAVA
tara:strand:- start:16 stop:297 length:282 start_codon:yes stop_codon:yes gene_type:complete